MTKMMTLVKAHEGVAAEDFRAMWRDGFFASVLAIGGVRDHLVRAVHNYVQPGEVRPDLPPSAFRWSGIGSYWFDGEDAARRLVAGPELASVVDANRDAITEVTHLLCDEHLIFDKQAPDASWKMIAFYKRLPGQSRRQSLEHYAGPHAALSRHPRNPMQRYVQNHVLLDYDNPLYNYDGGPEAWYNSKADAEALFENPRAMESAVADEDLFSIRGDCLYVYTLEEEIYNRDLTT
jgi:hypothetical protein